MNQQIGSLKNKEEYYRGTNGLSGCVKIEGISAREKTVMKIIKEKYEFEKPDRPKKPYQDFFCTVSHELKTPLTTLKSCAQLLNLDFAGGSTTEGLSIILRINGQITTVTFLINELLDVIKCHTGREGTSKVFYPHLAPIKCKLTAIRRYTKILNHSEQMRVSPENYLITKMNLQIDELLYLIENFPGRDNNNNNF